MSLYTKHLNPHLSHITPLLGLEIDWAHDSLLILRNPNPIVMPTTRISQHTIPRVLPTRSLDIDPGRDGENAGNAKGSTGVDAIVLEPMLG